MQAAFSPSLLGSAAVASQPHPDSKAVLIEANSIFVNDLLGLGIALQRTYRQGYAFDGRNSAITAVRGKPDQVVFEVSAHYATAGIAQPQPGGPPGLPAPTIPQLAARCAQHVLGHALLAGHVAAAADAASHV